jgi:CheY-like chemotaxis protein
MLIEDMLAELGCSIGAFAGSISQAAKYAELDDFDVGLLDVNVGGQSIYPIAERLAARSIPFAFLSGYDKAGLREEFRGRTLIRKPFTLETLSSGLRAALGRSHLGPT